ncbi:AMY1 [Acrasis kona]|uniref:AMY1 n=1 Tax=Acrasis kona TaxID=1008807 RepID=A0AAW2YNU0_9EUKA
MSWVALPHCATGISVFNTKMKDDLFSCSNYSFDKTTQKFNSDEKYTVKSKDQERLLTIGYASDYYYGVKHLFALYANNSNEFTLCRTDRDHNKKVITTFNMKEFNLKENPSFHILNGPVVVMHSKSKTHVLFKRNPTSYRLQSVRQDSPSVTKIVYCNHLFSMDAYQQCLILVYSDNLKSKKFVFKYLCLDVRKLAQLSELYFSDNLEEMFVTCLLNVKKKFLLPNSYAAVCTCVAFLKNPNHDVLYCFIGTLENQIVMFDAGLVTKIISVKSVPYKLFVKEYGMASTHLDTLLFVWCPQSVDVYSMLDEKLFHTVQDVKNVVFTDLYKTGCEQALFLHDQDLSNDVAFTILCHPNKPIIGRFVNKAFKDTSAKGQHLYSVLRALYTRMEEGNALISQLKASQDDRKSLIKDMNRVLTGSDDEQISLDHLLSGTSINIDFKLDVNITKDPQIKTLKSVPMVSSATQSINGSEWETNLTMSNVSKSTSCDLLPFSTTVPLSSRVYENKSRDSEQVSFCAVTETPECSADPVTINYTLLQTSQDSIRDYQHLGTIKPTDKQKLFGVTRKVNDQSLNLSKCELIIMKSKSSSVYSSSAIKLLSQILVSELGMGLVGSNSPAIINYEYDSTKKGFDSLLYCHVKVQKIRSDEFLCVTISADSEENLLLIVKIIKDELISTCVIAPSMITDEVLDNMYSFATSLVKENQFLMEELSKQDVKLHEKLLDVQSQVDLAFGNMLANSPCEVAHLLLNKE